MKKYFLFIFLLIATCLCGCSSNQATVDVLETCKVIGSVITETSISADKEYFTIAFENGIFYCEDRTNGSPVYTIKIPTDAEIEMFPILQSIVPKLTEEYFTKLETENEVSFFKAYKTHWYLYKSQEGNTIKYTIK